MDARLYGGPPNTSNDHKTNTSKHHKTYNIQTTPKGSPQITCIIAKSIPNHSNTDPTETKWQTK